MNANTLFPLATIALLAAGIARGALSAPDPEQTYGAIRYACAGVSEERAPAPFTLTPVAARPAFRAVRPCGACPHEG